jgi:hypothetical protein
MKDKYVRVSRNFDETLKDLETSFRVRTLVIQNAKPLDNFKMELTRKVFNGYVKFLYVFDKEHLDEASSKRVFTAVMLKTIDPVLKKYSFDNSPVYYKLFESDQIDNIRNIIKNTLNSISYDEIIAIRMSVENHIILVDKIIKDLVNSDIKIK